MATRGMTISPFLPVYLLVLLEVLLYKTLVSTGSHKPLFPLLGERIVVLSRESKRHRVPSDLFVVA